MHYPKEDDGEHYTACLLIKGLRGIEPRILYPKEESGSHCLLILDLKPHSAGLKNGSTIIDIRSQKREILILREALKSVENSQACISIKRCHVKESAIMKSGKYHLLIDLENPIPLLLLVE